MFNEKIVKDGLRLGDKCTIMPAQGRRKEILLNRKRIEIICAGNEVKWDYHRLILPCFEEKSSHWILELIEDKKESRYKIIGKDAEFTHNGVPIERGWPLRNCRLKFGYNYLVFEENSDDQRMDFLPKVKEELIRSNLPILLQGETGTGKTTLARKIHEMSDRVGRFVHLSLKSFNPQLIESELFGHVKGAFTGAIKDKKGAVAEAYLGTLFLDEIDSVDLTIQAKLLLFLDNFSYRPVGGEREYRSDIRLIVASAAPLFPQVEQGIFRKDLYYRIASCGFIELPSLSENKKRLAFMIDQYLSENHLSIDFELKKYYLQYDWPGNIRQLLSHLQYKKVLSVNGNITYGDEDKILAKVKSLNFTDEKSTVLSLQEMKKKYVTGVLNQMEGNISQTALALEISKNTLKKLIGDRDGLSLPQSCGY